MVQFVHADSLLIIKNSEEIQNDIIVQFHSKQRWMIARAGLSD
jgi:hypothetical protein